MPYINARWLSLFTLAVAVLVTLVSIVGWVSYEEATKTRSKFNSYGFSDLSETSFSTNWTQDDPAIIMLFTIDSFDPNKAGTVLGFHIDYIPYNTLIDTNNTGPLVVPIVPVRLLLQSTTTNFPAETVMPISTISQLLDGDVNRYPFDVFTVDYEFHASISPSNTSYGTPIPISAAVEGAVQGFKIDTAFQGVADDGSGVVITFTVRRSATTKVFSILIMIVMWCLSSAIFIAAMSVFFRERKVEPPLIAISTALLFALPNIRNSQPGIPSVAGTTSDMVGFFWNLLLVATSAFSLLLNYIIKNRRERETKLPQ